ncbi:hypothetical protein [Candidatus Phytoplasma ziziphi]|uniref:hypothetical protein n=1 Tax=Ziziphus jujuba witches'-broom phytoplasma TaxID=135727 RepID=UPI001EE0AA42
MAASKNNGKDIISSKEEAKNNVKKYYELYNTLENYSEEERNKIIQMLSNPEITKILEKKAKETKTQEKVLLQKNPIRNKNNLYKILLFIKTLQVFFYLTNIYNW